MGQIRINGRWQDNFFEPADSSGETGYYHYNLSCRFAVPVNGNYSIRAADVSTGAATNYLLFELVPGQSAAVYVLAPAAESVPAIAILASVVIALGMLAFGAFALFDFMFRDVHRIAALEAQKKQILEDIKMIKYRFMKRQIDEPTLKRSMAEKEKEYTLVVSQLKTLKKDLKAAEQ
jgi:hypothetical protein